MLAKVVEPGTDMVNPLGNCSYGNRPAGSCYTGRSPLFPSFCVNGLYPVSGDCSMGVNGHGDL